MSKEEPPVIFQREMARQWLDIMLENFRTRKAENEGQQQIDNARLPAGALMYYYCKYCGDLTDTKPELYLDKARTVCVPCEELEKLGAIPK